MSAATTAPSSVPAVHWNDLADADHDNDDNEELDDDVPDLPSSSTPANSAKAERIIRRRSSKACDQCRKSKCKCERTRDGEPCRSCVLLGTECTFLGPSRKRGPPKGYIDAIESRLHQLEALLGIIIASSDPRAQSLIDDLSQDTLARDIIARVDSSAFGPKGRKQAASSSREAYLADADGPGSSSSRVKRQPTNRSALAVPPEGSAPFVTPSNEWQDHLASRIAASGLARQGNTGGPSTYMFNSQPSSSSTYQMSSLPPLQIDLGSFAAAYSDDVKPSPSSAVSAGPTRSTQALQPPAVARSQQQSISPTRRQRRRIDDGNPIALARDWSLSPPRSDELSSAETSDSEDLVGAIGQLSIDDHEQLRFHGKASGLHLLGKGNRRDKRIENGIWRFPPARVWPPVLNHVAPSEEEIAARARLPSREQQEHLIELYFTYVHPMFPVVVKSQFLEDFRARSESPYNDSGSPASLASSPSRKLSQRVPTLLLLSMFALASRYSNFEQPLPPEGNMWDAGDSYLEDAKTVLNKIYANSRPSTCQALLLMSYREIGIGAMAQAWLYVGMAVRMAQDLGLHRSSAKFHRGGASLFTTQEIEMRRRIWYSCVIMDRYVSTYIGRPLSIYERDFDTELPTEDAPEENECWDHHHSLAQDLEHNKYMEQSEYVPVPSRPVATMKASASLAALISMIVQSLYSIRSPSSSGRHAEAADLEKLLDKWYLDLPEYLRYEPSTRKLPIPPPHIMTLLMNYWTTVLLLHRPFIHLKTGSNEAPDDPRSLKAWDLCMNAANRISSLVSVYMENFCLKRSAAFLSYYVFTAGIMHVTTLTMRPTEVQASINLQKCMEALKATNVLWPSAGRAWELLHGSNVNMREAELSRLANADSRRKRLANEPAEENEQRMASTSRFAARMAAPPAHPVRPIPVPPPFSTLGPTTAASSDSFFGPYSRWEPDLYHQQRAAYGHDAHPQTPQPSSATSMQPPPLPSVQSYISVPPQSVNGSRYPTYWGEYHEAYGDAALPNPLPAPIYGAAPLIQQPGSMQQVHHSPSYPDFPGYGATTVMQPPYSNPNASSRMQNGSHPLGHHP